MQHVSCEDELNDTAKTNFQYLHFGNFESQTFCECRKFQYSKHCCLEG